MTEELEQEIYCGDTVTIVGPTDYDDWTVRTIGFSSEMKTMIGDKAKVVAIYEHEDGERDYLTYELEDIGYVWHGSWLKLEGPKHPKVTEEMFDSVFD